MVNDVYIQGIDKRATTRSSTDGFCKSITNLRAKGTTNSIRWETIKQASPLVLGNSSAKGYVEILITTSGSGGTTAQATITFGETTVVVSDYSSPTYLPSFTAAISQALNDNANFSANFVSTYTIFSTVETLIRIETKTATDLFNSFAFHIECDNGIYKFNGVKNDITVQIRNGLSNPTTNPIYSFWQRRSIYGDFTINKNANLNRLVVIYSDRIVLFDESTPNNFVQSVAPYAINLNNIEVTGHSTLDEINLITLSSNNIPEQTLVLIDDAIFPLEFPDLPYMSIKHKKVNSESFLADGQYGLFFAYEMQDGSTIKPSHIIPIYVYNDTGCSTKLEILNQGIAQISNDYFVWKKFIRTISIFMCIKSENLFDVFNQVYYKVGEIGIDAGSITTLEVTNDSIPTGRTYEVDVINAHHTITGRVVSSYNKRFILGGLSYDYVKPRWRDPLVTSMIREYVPPLPINSFPYLDSTETTSNYYNYKLIVEIQTESGSFYRQSKIFNTNKLYPEFEYGFYQYPDRRAKTLAIFREIESGVWTLYKQFQLKASNTLNLAYKWFPSTYQTDSLYKTFIDVNVDTNAKSFESQKFALSTSKNPLIFTGANVYRVGQYSNEMIQGFASNALPISTGQFGEYPLYVFTNKSIWALQQGQDASIAFSSIQLVSTTEGALNPKAITNIGQVILFASYQGIFTLANGTTSLISKPINDVVDWNSISNNVTLSYFIDNTTEELWVCLPTITYVYQLSINAWYSFSRSRKLLFQSVGNSLYGIDYSGIIFNEIGTEIEPFELITNPIHLGSIDVLKRLHNLFVRAECESLTISLSYVTNNNTLAEHSVYSGNNKTIRTNFGSAYAFVIGLSSLTPSATDYIELLQLEYEHRYRHRIRS